MSFLEEALVSTEKLTIYPSEVQSEPHLPSDVVLGQLVTERIGLENGIVLSFSS